MTIHSFESTSDEMLNMLTMDMRYYIIDIGSKQTLFTCDMGIITIYIQLIDCQSKNMKITWVS